MTGPKIVKLFAATAVPMTDFGVKGGDGSILIHR